HIFPLNDKVLYIAGILLFLSMNVLIICTKLIRSSLIFILLFFIPFVIYLIAILLLYQVHNMQTKYLIPIVLFIAALLQIIVLMTEISLSDDVYRYITEGKALVNGINPYYTSIDDLSTNLQDNYSELVNNSNVTSPYPPLALLLFALLYIVYPEPITYRIFFSLGFLASIIVCYRLLQPENKWKVIIYAWNPLLHLETGNGTHFDSIVVLLVMLAIWGLQTGRVITASGFLFLAFMLKYYPLILIVLFWRQLGKKGLLIVSVGLLMYGSFIILYPPAISGLIIYVQDWYFNASLFWLVIQVIKDFMLLKIIFGGIFIIIVVLVALKVNNNSLFSPETAIGVIGLLLILQPVFHPWYVFWLFPFLLYSNKKEISWILLTGTLILSYHVYITYDVSGIWIEWDVLRLIEFIPFYACLAFEKRKIFQKIIEHVNYSLT
ncbi:MAG: hypothetical protein ACXAEU_16665, partial [Candidatus Hodarchaeales archaeon]